MEILSSTVSVSRRLHLRQRHTFTQMEPYHDGSGTDASRAASVTWAQANGSKTSLGVSHSRREPPVPSSAAQTDRCPCSAIPERTPILRLCSHTGCGHCWDRVGTTPQNRKSPFRGSVFFFFNVGFGATLLSSI